MHARQGGLNDLVPGVPGIPGGSPWSANGPSMVDETAGAGPRFASFDGLAGDQTATQALLPCQRHIAGWWLRPGDRVSNLEPQVMSSVR